MKIEKAIEILKDIRNAHASARTPDAVNAIQLGEEALKRLEQNRRFCLIPSLKLLPGETNE